MEIFSHTYATTYGRSYAVTAEEYLQQSLEPPDRLTTRELQQLRAIREEVESRPRPTRFEKRYVKSLKTAEELLGQIQQNCRQEISLIRESLRKTNSATNADSQAITIALLVAAIHLLTKENKISFKP